LTRSTGRQADLSLLLLASLMDMVGNDRVMSRNIWNVTYIALLYYMNWKG
jgi:hypothetical protein